MKNRFYPYLTLGIVLGSVSLALGCGKKSAPEAPTGGTSTSTNERVKTNRTTGTTMASNSSSASVDDSSTFTTGDFEGCPPEGSGGDPDLNKMKNRDKAPPSTESMTVAQIVGTHPQHESEMTKALRSHWPSAALAEAKQWENRGVSVEGFLLMAKQSGSESCNCKSETRHDYHLWIADSPGDVSEDKPDRSQAMIFEVSPRVQANHANWALRNFTRLAKQRSKIRISGWLMWDQEHPEEIGKTRGTLWEIHPVHKIEVFSSGRWRSIDDGS